MTWRRNLLLAGAGLALSLAGCNPPSPSTASTRPQNPAAPGADPLALPAPQHLNHAQPKLRTMKLWLGTNEIVAEVALKQSELATGMMFRTSMGWNEGMLFVFSIPHQTGFYMKNTVVPLSAAYIDPDGIILEIHELKPRDETPVLAGTDQVQYVLEMNQGWFQTNHVEVGAALRTEVGTMRETFYRGK